MAVWKHAKQAWEEIAPATVKKLLTGSGKAGKEEVAGAYERYVGCHNYKTDDESEAAAVGIAWLLQVNLLIQKM